MTTRLIRILQIPASNSAGWREAIFRAAQSAGFDYFDHWGGQPPPIDPLKSTIVVGWDDRPFDLEATDWAVLTCSPDEAARVQAELHSVSDRDAIYHASARFGMAAMRAASGAAVFDDGARTIEIPALGVVERVVEPTASALVVASRAGPLSFYGSLPLKPGASVDWPVALWTYPIGRSTDDGTSRINLLGRRRVLFNGPNITLPPGMWRITATFMLDASDPIEFLLEWGFGHDVASLTHMFATPGRYELSLDQFWPTAASADFRGSIMTPVLEGLFELESCVVSLIDLQTTEVSNID